MATSSLQRIQKIPNEMPVKWLIMTVSKYICICILQQKWNKWITVEGPDYCNSSNLFVVGGKNWWCEMRPHCLPFGVSTCDFHLLLWLSAQQDIPERVVAWLNINSPSKQPEVGVPLAKSGPRFLLKINQPVLSLDPEISTCAARNHV